MWTQFMGTLQHHNIYNWDNIELGSNVSVSWCPSLTIHFIFWPDGLMYQCLLLPWNASAQEDVIQSRFEGPIWSPKPFGFSCWWSSDCIWLAILQRRFLETRSIVIYCSLLTKLMFAFLTTVMPYTAVYGYLPYRRYSQCLRVRFSDGPGTYRTPTVKFTAVTVYGTVRSPKQKWRERDILNVQKNRHRPKHHVQHDTYEIVQFRRQCFEKYWYRFLTSYILYVVFT